MNKRISPLIHLFGTLELTYSLGGSVILKFNDQKVDLETNSGFKHVSMDFYPTFFKQNVLAPF